MKGQISRNAPEPALFVNEHLKSAENRINLALFSTLCIEPIRIWFLQNLRIPDTCVVYPPADTCGVRPDFVAVSSRGLVKAWIEVELGGKDTNQLGTYRELFQQPVRSITGVNEDGSDLSLDQIAAFLAGPMKAKLTRQQKKAVEVLTLLIAQCKHDESKQEYTEPGQDLASLNLLELLRERLGDAFCVGTPPPKTGQIQFSTITQKGWTLRVYAPGAKMRSVNLLRCHGVGSGLLHVPSEKLLRRCLPSRKAALKEYSQYWRTLGADHTRLRERQSARVDEASVIERVDDLAHLMLEFVN